MGHPVAIRDSPSNRRSCVSRRKLVLYLPHPVRHQDGRAKWDAAARELSVTLPIIREEW
jgi:hypothetical protein